MKVFSFCLFLLLGVNLLLNVTPLMGQSQGRSTAKGWLFVTGRPWETDKPGKVEPAENISHGGCDQTLIGSVDLSKGHVCHQLDRSDNSWKATVSGGMYNWFRQEIFLLNLFCR
jgi:hypothetical protein